MPRLTPHHTSPERSTRHAMQCLFLERLNRLIELRAMILPEWSAEDVRLINYALYSTYLDCVALGLRPVARALIAAG